MKNKEESNEDIVWLEENKGYFIDKRDGNRYNVVKIGNQIWMAENLNVDKFRNGEPIPNVKTNEDWELVGDKKQPAWCYYDNDPANGVKYGKLYNWYAVNDERGIAPEGWHVASNDEWKQLEMYIGMPQEDADDIAWRGTNEGGKLKEVGTVYWESPNVEATNEFGFAALPGGYRFDNEDFRMIKIYSVWWTATESEDFVNDGLDAWNRSIRHNRGDIGTHPFYKNFAFSVRCVKD